MSLTEPPTNPPPLPRAWAALLYAWAMARRSPPPLRCPKSGKVGYESRLLALDALNRLDKHPLRVRDEVRVYHCPFCGAYHLTKQEADTGREA